jgi:hypothetical protein
MKKRKVAVAIKPCGAANSMAAAATNARFSSGKTVLGTIER